LTIDRRRQIAYNLSPKTGLISISEGSFRTREHRLRDTNQAGKNLIEGGKMGVYVMLTTLTDEGRKTVKTNPERIREVNQEVEAMGVKVLAQYALLGQYDFANILEAPDAKAVARVAIELGSRGTLQTMTLPAMSIDEFITSIR